jgi:hypothetical protein
MPLQYRRTIGRNRGIDSIPDLWRLWHDRSLELFDIATHFNVSITTVRRTALKLGLPSRQSIQGENTEREDGDPSEEEIWGEGGLTEKIRSSWSSRREYEARINATSVIGDEVGAAKSKPHQRRA